MARSLGVIPARGGSKRVPRKNVRMLCGKPLIAWTIEAAKRSNLTDWVVTTDDQHIAQIASLWGAEHIHLRGEMGDEHTSGQALRDAYKWMGRDYEIVVCLHPTSPIRDPKHIDQAIDMLWASEWPSLASVSCRKRCYSHNASIYALKTPLPANHFSDQSMPFLMDRYHSLDIDEEYDLAIAELYLNGQQS